MEIAILLLFAVAYAANGSQSQCDSDARVEMWNKVSIPRVGFGTAAMGGQTTIDSVTMAVENGFRFFDGAEATEWYDDYALGTALNAAIDNKIVTRQSLFIASKVHPKNLGSKNTEKAILHILDNLNVKYLDLLLLHYPVCGHWIPQCKGIEVEGTWKDSWRVLEDYYNKGIIKAIGVSNFEYDQMQELLEFANVKPHMVQNWMDPFNQDTDVRRLCDENDVLYTSYSTLGGQWEHIKGENLVKTSPTIQKIAKKYNTSVQQLVLKWALQKGVIVIPRSSTLKNIRKNAELLNYDINAPTIEEQDMQLIDALEP
uniref:NADP-dependent oxidoreductase domain-containing protein n=1 Tax=Mucochytrium quahogii TaxID=96639 RepID=A0A7S2SM38_9STRA|mmetsp:Transcript_7502/g.12059  ORF Transcript_7502/g.12059 Transcript_7502/m.12059 type:complete len:314 (-) Transcript_7502:64-1005(-)|eukprot:CAMPEP_0203750634 /NCGR_PEP_ID=MMETSP0098-20131031/4845_1 /ASSEMBLY_ACC=CAM_ASM_000208 /TAXON_ID=96639 /ORGANISM=" , Strain NY0313808BC1" /LENGTH=313 /DNA_ID=CAMNT_0050640027 /DNA_START=237 /DNA_END=1178 /DNA_ORIENTATION=+